MTTNNPSSSSTSHIVNENPTNPTVESLFSLNNVDIVSVCDGIITRVASGKISVLSAITGSTNMLFLLCDSFSYPLVEQPIMKSDDRLYLLPAGRGNTTNNGITSTSSSSSSSSPASSTTYVLSIATSVPVEEVQEFERILAEHTNFRSRSTQTLVVDRQLGSTPSSSSSTATVPRTPTAGTEIVPHALSSSTSTTTHAIVPHHTGASSYLPSSLSHLSVTDVGSGISTGVRLAGTVTASALVVGAEYAGKGVKWVADKAVTIVGKTDKPVHINDETKVRLDQARMVSRAAVVVSGAVVVGAATMAKQLGSAVSAAFLSTEYGKNLAASSTSETGQAAKQVAASSLVAFGEIWDGLETAAKVFGTHASDATTHFVGEVYGKEAAVVANKSLALAGDVGLTALNMRNISVGGLIRKTGVETAKEVITNLGDGEHPNNGLPGGSRTPLLTNGTPSTPHGSSTNTNNISNLLPVAAALSTIAATTTTANHTHTTSNGPSLTDTMAAISILSSVATTSTHSAPNTPVVSTPTVAKTVPVPNKTAPITTTTASTSVSSSSSSVTPKPVHNNSSTSAVTGHAPVTTPHAPHGGSHSIGELTAAATRIHPTPLSSSSTTAPTIATTTTTNTNSSSSSTSQPSSRRNSDSTNSTFSSVNLKHVARDLTK